MGKLVLTSETLASPSPGTLEYDGSRMYFTPLGTQRGLVPGMQYYVTDSNVVGSNSTANQNILGVGVEVASNTIYAVEGNFNFFKSAGTTSHSFRFLWGGTAAFNRIATNLLVQASGQGYVTVSADRAVRQYTLETVGPLTVLTSSTAFLTVNIQVRGILSVSTGGTLIPQYNLTAAPGGTYTASASNNMSIWPIGPAGSSVSVGAWS